MFNTGTWQRLSYFKIPQIHLQKKQEQKKKRISVVIVNSHWSCGSTKTAEDTDKTAKETLHLISLTQSLFAQIPSSAYVKKKTPNKTKHIFYFLLINTTVSHCKNPDNPGNPVITEKKRALCLTMTINKRRKKISSFTFLIFFNDVSQCHPPPPPPHASFEGLHSLPKSIIGDHNRVFLLPLIRRSAIWAGEKKMAEKRRHV